MRQRQEIHAHAEDLDPDLDLDRIRTNADQLRVGPGSRSDMTMIHDCPDGPKRRWSRSEDAVVLAGLVLVQVRVQVQVRSRCRSGPRSGPVQARSIFGHACCFSFKSSASSLRVGNLSN